MPKIGKEIERGYYRIRLQSEIPAVSGAYDTSVPIAVSIPPKCCQFFGEICDESGLIAGEAKVHSIKSESSCNLTFTMGIDHRGTIKY